MLGATSRVSMSISLFFSRFRSCFLCVCFVFVFFSTCLVFSLVCAPDGDCHAPAGYVAHEGNAPAFRSAVEPRNPAAAIEITGKS